VLRERRELDTPGGGPGFLEGGGSGESEVPLQLPLPEPIVEAQPEPPPELDFWDDWIRKKQLVPEPTTAAAAASARDTEDTEDTEDTTSQPPHTTLFLTGQELAPLVSVQV